MGQDPGTDGAATLTPQGGVDSVVQPSDAGVAAQAGGPEAVAAVRDGASSDASPDAQQLRHEIEQTRRELGETVATLAQKADVKTQARERLGETKATVAHKKEELLGKARQASPQSASTFASRGGEKARENPLPLAALAAFAAGFLIGRRRD